MNDFPDISDLSPGDMPYAEDWNTVKEAALRRIPQEFIDLHGGGGGGGGSSTTSGMAALLTDLISGHTALAENLTYHTDVGWLPNGSIITVWDRVMQSGSISQGTIVRYIIDGDKNWVDGSSCVNMMGFLFPYG